MLLLWQTKQNTTATFIFLKIMDFSHYLVITFIIEAPESLWDCYVILQMVMYIDKIKNLKPFSLSICD